MDRILLRDVAELWIAWDDTNRPPILKFLVRQISPKNPDRPWLAFEHPSDPEVPLSKALRDLAGKIELAELIREGEGR